MSDLSVSSETQRDLLLPHASTQQLHTATISTTISFLLLCHIVGVHCCYRISLGNALGLQAMKRFISPSLISPHYALTVKP